MSDSKGAAGVFGPELNMVPRGSDALAVIALRAEAEAEALGWGGERESTLRWFWLYDHGHIAGGGNLRGVGMALAEVVGNDLTGTHPVQLLEYLARHVQPGRDLIGFVLVHECWIATWAPGDVENRQRITAAAERREVWRQPDRQEARVAHLQMLTGQVRIVMRVRGHEPAVLADGPGMDIGAVAVEMQRLADTLRRRKYGRRG